MLLSAFTSLELSHLSTLQRLLLLRKLVVAAGHWQGGKTYPYAQGIFPANTQTLGDGILHQLHQSTHYWWCWAALGVGIAYVLVMNIAIVILLKILPREFSVAAC